MKKLLLFFIAAAIFARYPSPQIVSLYTHQVITLESLKAWCAATTENASSFSKPMITAHHFFGMQEKIETLGKQEIAHAQWLHERAPSAPDSEFKPFTQKVVLPEGSKAAFFGDLHGNIHSLSRILDYLQKQGYINNHLKIIDPNFYLFFLGDYVDRGSYGVEVIFTLMTLKLKNPNNVYLVRGNHEDIDLNAHYGFTEELLHKYPQISDQAMLAINNLYNRMPVAIYLGISNSEHTDYIQCCHGGLEIGYNPKELLESSCTAQIITSLDRIQELQKLPRKTNKEIKAAIPGKELIDFKPLKPVVPSTLGLMWNDFNADRETMDYAPGRGWVFGHDTTHAVLAQQSAHKSHIKAIFRAHQHHGTMLQMLKKEQGIVSLYNGLVHTFLTAPIARLDFPYDSIGILDIGSSYSTSQLKHCVITE